MIELQPSMFCDSAEVLEIFNEEAIVNARDILMTLEVYKFCTRASIIAELKALGVTEDIIFDVKKVNSIKELTSIERMFHVLCSKGIGDHVTVLYDVTESVNKDGLELQLGKYQIDYLAVTPFNFRELQEPDLSWVKYDPGILFKRILLEALHLNATDLHFTVEHHNLVPTYPVKYRQNGNLYQMNLFTLTEELNKSIICNFIEHKTDANSHDLITASGITTVADDPLGTGDLELRIAANKVKNGWHCVIRIQTEGTFNFDIEHLGFPQKTQDALYNATRKRSGILFVTGAIRSGKNTTVFAMLNKMIESPVKIVSYESPVEVLMPFTQIDYQYDASILAHAVRLAKKQDVNVAYLNEIPNKEVAFAVQDLVNSSVYVITTLHLDRLWHLPYKLSEYFSEDYKNIISQINGVFNQKMFSVPCPHCKDLVLTESLNPDWSQFLLDRKITSVPVNHGCDICNGTGEQSGSNQPYVEFLRFTPKLKSELLACNAPYEMEQVLKKAVEEKKCTLEDTMSAAIAAGDLSVKSLDFIL